MISDQEQEHPLLVVFPLLGMKIQKDETTKVHAQPPATRMQPQDPLRESIAKFAMKRECNVAETATTMSDPKLRGTSQPSLQRNC